MRDRDTILLESLYSFIVEGKKETIAFLEKNGADQNTISFFTKQDEKGKPLFPTDHAIVLFSWLKDNPVKLGDVEEDYKNYRKYFPNKNLRDFKNYMDYSEQVHAKVGEKSFAQRNKEESGDIDVHGMDKENVLADDEDVLILKGDDEHKCVRYGKGYSFCISRPYGGNMYGNYRLTKASTFYFIYFKKIPKDNPKHIMVLDRTQDGWEWTFGENQTRVIKGGWNTVVKQYPILAKYKDKFVNKPLTDEETVYQQKLAKFTENPTKKDFEQFSYKEKTDVLKFGMQIPEDLFDSLDKFLRNEYISVGPNIEKNIYNKLNDKEKERYVKVRKVILNQQEPTTTIDVKICESDPELFEKYLKGDFKQGKREHQKIISKIDENGVRNGDIEYTSVYFPLDLSTLQICEGDINAFFVKTAAYLSNLRICKGEINVSDVAQTLDLSNLQTCEGGIDARSAQTLDLSNLQTCEGGIYANSAQTITIPRHLKDKLNGVPENCKIIHPEDKQVRMESFKQFVLRKY